jgi:hypothetical protein
MEAGCMFNSFCLHQLAPPCVAGIIMTTTTIIIALTILIALCNVLCGM